MLTKQDIKKVEETYLSGFEDKVSVGNLKIYDGRDLTPFSRAFFSNAFLFIPKVYGVDVDVYVTELKTDIIKQEGIVVSKNIDQLYEILPELWMDEKRAKGYLEMIEDIQKEFRISLANNDLCAMYDSAMRHLAFYADSFFPEEHFSDLIGRQDFSLLYDSDYSTYLTIHKGVLDLVEEVYLGLEPNINGFIQNIGYLAGDDMLPSSYETREGVWKHIELYKKSNTLVDIIKQKENFYFEKVVHKINVQEYMKKLPLSEEVSYLCYLAKKVAEYNEQNRMIVKKAFQVFRNYFERNNLDLNKASYNDLLNNDINYFLYNLLSHPVVPEKQVNFPSKKPLFSTNFS